MDALAAFCSECSSLAAVQLQTADSTLRLRSLAALFVGMTDNVVRVQQAITNNTCSVTNRMTQWTNETVREARVLTRKLREEPRQLNFFEKRFLCFCVALESDEQNERLVDQLHTLLCRAFLIQIAIYCDEATVVVDLLPGISTQSARQEFLGCVYDLKQRIAASAENSAQAYKQIVFQISEEYQNRQDERTVAGKRAFIRWHKAANDMIKSQLQQKLSERERSLQAKEDELKGLKIEMEALLADKNKQVNASAAQGSESLKAAQKENAALKAQLESKSGVEVALTESKSQAAQLEAQLKAKEAEVENEREMRAAADQKTTALEQQLNQRTTSEKEALEKAALQATELVTLRTALEQANERGSAAEKQHQETTKEILILKEQLASAEEAHRQNGTANEELLALREQIKTQENQLTETRASVTAQKKENATLREQVKAKQNEIATISQSVNKLVAESESLKAQLKQKEKLLKTTDDELKALRAELVEKQEKEVQMLEQNVEISETCRSLQEQISQKEQEIMQLNNTFGEMEDKVERAMDEKTEAVESLERKIKRLSTSLDSTKQELQEKIEELEELQR